MATQKPDLNRIWAESAPAENVKDPDVANPGKFSAGWIAELPPFEFFNFLWKLVTQGLKYQNENGIGAWDNKTTYARLGLARGSDGKLYEAVKEQKNNDPTTDDGTNWQLFKQGGPSLGTNSVIRTNAKNINEDISFTGNENGSTVGPITIDDGYTVTIENGSTWVVL